MIDYSVTPTRTAEKDKIIISYSPNFSTLSGNYQINSFIKITLFPLDHLFFLTITIGIFVPLKQVNLCPHTI